VAQLKITWTKSYIGKPENQRRVIHALGLRRLHHTVVHGDTPTIRGMVHKVQHLLSVEELAEPAQTPRRRTRRARSGETKS
jgi:large subunit ribosomal protein L30